LATKIIRDVGLIRHFHGLYISEGVAGGLAGLA